MSQAARASLKGVKPVRTVIEVGTGFSLSHSKIIKMVHAKARTYIKNMSCDIDYKHNSKINSENIRSLKDN